MLDVGVMGEKQQVEPGNPPEEQEDHDATDRHPCEWHPDVPGSCQAIEPGQDESSHQHECDQVGEEEMDPIQAFVKILDAIENEGTFQEEQATEMPKGDEEEEYGSQL